MSAITQGSTAKLIQEGIAETQQQLEDGTYPVPTVMDLMKFPIHTRVRQVNFLEDHKLLPPVTIANYKKTLGIEGMENRF